MKKWIKFIAGSVLLAASAGASAAELRVAVDNHTMFGDLAAYISEQTPADLQEALRARKLAVFAHSFSFPSLHACYATVGITGVPEKNRNARYPDNYSRAGKIMAADTWNKGACEGAVVKDALAALLKRPQLDLFAGLDAVRAAAQPLAANKARNDTVALATLGGIVHAEDVLFERLHAHSMGRLYDYRAVQTAVISEMTTFNDGRIMCVATAGLTGKTVTGKNPRWPGFYAKYLKMGVQGDEAACKADAARLALNALLGLPHEEILKDFAVASEASVPRPDLAKVNAAVRKLQKSTKPSSLAHNTNRNSCTNNCINGNCTRTFPDGRTEHWTAPRVFDPFTRDWKWDTTTNACGG